MIPEYVVEHKQTDLTAEQLSSVVCLLIGYVSLGTKPNRCQQWFPVLTEEMATRLEGKMTKSEEEQRSKEFTAKAKSGMRSWAHELNRGKGNHGKGQTRPKFFYNMNPKAKKRLQRWWGRCCYADP